VLGTLLWPGRRVVQFLCEDAIEFALRQRDKIVDLGDQVVRSLEARIIEIVSIKHEQEEQLRKPMSSLAVAEFYTKGGHASLNGNLVTSSVIQSVLALWGSRRCLSLPLARPPPCAPTDLTDRPYVIERGPCV